MTSTTQGYLTVTDYDKFIEAYKNNITALIDKYKESKDGTVWSDVFYPIKLVNDTFQKQLHPLYEKYFTTGSHYFKHDPVENFIKEFKPCFDYCVEFNQKFNIIYTMEVDSDTYYLISFGKYIFLVPDNSFMDVTVLKDYSNQTIAQIRGQTETENSVSLIPKNGLDISINDVHNNIDAQNSKINTIKKQLEEVKEAKCAELADLQAEIDAKVAELNEKKRALMEILEQKKREMELQKEQLETQLFVLESEIYAIRCFLGEVINFTKLKSGKSEPIDTPIILFQKMRYLDEEMGKLASLYDFDGEDLNLFEKFISVNDECLETFCPSRKCVSLLRCTKNNVHHRTSSEIANMIESYEAYHGRTIGILIRDGENLYIGWTDEEKVDIPDDMFFTPNIVTHTNKEDADFAAKQTSSKNEIVSRYFIFSILQGILENSDIINLEGKHNFTRPDNMVIFSAADNWISDNKYGSLSDLIDKYSDEKINKVGDDIIITRGLRPDHNNMWGDRNDRGIGYANRTHDVSAGDGTIHKLNHMLSYGHYYIFYVENNPTFKTSRKYISPSGKEYDYRREIYEHNIKDLDIKSIEETDDITVVDKGYVYNYEWFISLPKDLAWYKDPSEYKVLPRANFQIFSGEYINLTFFNSIWISYIIQTKNIGNLGWGPRGKDVDYAYVIRYLKIIREHLIKREKIEAELIQNHLPDNINLDEILDWQVLLSEWKYEHSIHNFGVRAAKQFVKHIEAHINTK